jgi:hypothetical protein
LGSARHWRRRPQASQAAADDRRVDDGSQSGAGDGSGRAPSVSGTARTTLERVELIGSGAPGAEVHNPAPLAADHLAAQHVQHREEEHRRAVT